MALFTYCYCPIEVPRLDSVVEYWVPRWMPTAVFADPDAERAVRRKLWRRVYRAFLDNEREWTGCLPNRYHAPLFWRYYARQAIKKARRVSHVTLVCSRAGRQWHITAIFSTHPLGESEILALAERYS